MLLRGGLANLTPMTAAKNIIRLSLLGIASLSICPAIAIQPDQVFHWSGLCTDCIGTATATLTLRPQYVPGTMLVTADLVSFVYNPTNLLPAGFSILPGDLTGIFGSIPASLPGGANLALTSSTNEFSTQPTGFWCGGSNCMADFGTESTYASTTVPEPGTFALIGTGLGLAALLRRRISA